MTDPQNFQIAELQKKVAEADAVAEMKSNFLATMSHEIRTPMQTIYGLLELIIEEKPEERIRSMAETAKNSASGLLEILDDILDVAKMDANAMELDVFEVPVRLLVRGMLEALAVKVHGIQVKLVDDIAQNVPFVIIGDPKRLRQILMNLCSNAVKFTKEGSVTVRVSTDIQAIPRPDQGVGLRFEVIDTGVGMSDEVCKRLFKPFSQADNSTSRKFGGTGLGLSISKKLVELMDGQIGVTSKEGHGSTFWFEIPTAEVSTNENTVVLPDLEGISVLSVEDHPQGAKEIVNSLRSMGAKVESCGTYREGLELMKRLSFDVAVIDQGLPDGLGLDLIREILPLRPFMGMVMYTVRDDIGLSHSLKSLGVTYLTKPASRAGLGEAVKSAARKNAGVMPEGPTRLLIAEDTEGVRDILKRQLDRVGVEADFVSDGRGVLEALKTGKYGILITDLHMPDIDGYGVVQAIRDEEKLTGKHFPVIVLTADVQMAQRETYMRYGFDECLLKPVSLAQFKRLLFRWRLLDEASVSSSLEKREKKSEPAQEEKAINRQCIIEQMGALDDSTIEMFRMFPNMTQPVLNEIADALEVKDFKRLSEAGHSLKGSARSACCNVLGDLASQLQDDAAAHKPCEALGKKIMEEFERVKIEIGNLKI